MIEAKRVFVWMIVLVLIPLFVVRAQSSDEIVLQDTASSTQDVVEEVAADTTVLEPAATSTDDGLEVVASSTTEVIEESTVTVDEPAVDTTASSTEMIVDTASSTASVELVATTTERIVLQPRVTMDTYFKTDSRITAEITLKNLTCKECERMTPEVPILAYYTPVYPNDGPDSKETGEQFDKQLLAAPELRARNAHTLTWEGRAGAPGTYYFVVIVDPENAAGMYTMHRSEFIVD